MASVVEGRWSADDVSRLRELCKEPLSQKAIARLLNRTEKAVNKKMSILSLRSNSPVRGVTVKWSKDRLDILIRMYRAQATAKEIAQATGGTTAGVRHQIDRAVARGIFKRFGPRDRTRVLTEKETGTLRSMAEAGRGRLAVRTALQCNSSTLDRLLALHGVTLDTARGKPKPKPAGRPAIDFRSRTTKSQPLAWSPKPRPEKLPRVPNTPWALNISFDQLRMFDCRFITTPTAKLDEARFCGQSVLPGHSYCCDCHRIVYQQIDRRLGPPSLRKAA